VFVTLGGARRDRGAPLRIKRHPGSGVGWGPVPIRDHGLRPATEHQCQPFPGRSNCAFRPARRSYSVYLRKILAIDVLVDLVLIRCRLASLAHDLNDDPLGALPVELGIVDLLPGAEVQFGFGYRHNHLVMD
jgi:hypothetical protein